MAVSRRPRDPAWPQTAVAPPPKPLPAAEPPPGGGVGFGVLFGSAVLALGLGALAVALLTRHRDRPAAPATVVVTAPAHAGGSGAAKVGLPVPDLSGRRARDARGTLGRAGLRARLVTVPSALPRGSVTAQSPPPGATVARGGVVRLNVSNGAKAAASAQAAATRAASTNAETTTAATPAPPPTVRVPRLSGELRTALAAVHHSGLAASVRYVPSTQPFGTVVAQFPAPGAPAPASSQVTINVSSGRRGVEHTVPGTVGMSIPEAVAAVNRAGLRLVMLRRSTVERSQAGKVVAQTPPAGRRAPENAQVVVYMGAYGK